MKRIIAIACLMAAAFTAPRGAFAQQKLILCNTGTSAACSSASNTGTGTSGDPAWKFNGKINENFTQLYGMFGGGTSLQTTGTASNTDIAGLFGGSTGTGKLVLQTSPTLTTPNIGAATGASLSVSGQLTSTVSTGTAPLVVSSTTNVPNLNASSLGGATFASPGAIGGTTPAAGAFTTLSASSGSFSSTAGGVVIGSPTGGAQGAGTLNMAGCYVNGVACGTGGSAAFSSITGGTNTAAAMLVGTGASIATTGSGTIAASSAPLSGLSGLGTGVATALGINVGSAGAPVLFNGAGGTPSAINLTNATALPLSAMANLGTTTTVLHGNAAGNPSFGPDNLTTDVTGILPGANGGSGNGFFAVTGPTTSLKTFTFPNASATVLTTNAAVTVAQGGTGLGTLTAHGVLLGEGTSNVAAVTAMAADTVLQGQGATSDPAAASLVSCSSASNALTYNTTTHAFGCNTISGSGTVNSGTSGQLAYYASTGTAVSGATVGAGLTLNSGTLTTSYAINAQVGTTYTVLSSDAGKLVTFSNASPVAVALPQATGSFAAGFSFDAQNLGAGLVTITPTTSTINGAATLTIPQNMGCTIVSDGTNYQVSACTALGANALQINGAAVPASAALTATNSSKQLTAVTVGTGVVTALGVNTGSAGAVVVNGGALGTPSSGTLTNATGLPVGGIASMAANTIAGNGTGGSASPTALAVGALNISRFQAVTTFTVAGTGCTPSAHAGTAFAGTVTLAAGPCTSLTVTMNGATGFTTTTGYHCNVGDRTLQNAGTWFGEWGESATTTTTATLPIPSAAGATDVISFDCTPY